MASVLLLGLLAAVRHAGPPSTVVAVGPTEQVSVTLTTVDQRSLLEALPSIPLGPAPSAPTIRVDATAGVYRCV